MFKLALLLVVGACALDAPVITLDLDVQGLNKAYSTKFGRTHTQIPHNFGSVAGRVASTFHVCPAGYRTSLRNCPHPTASAYDHHDGNLAVTKELFLVNLEGKGMMKKTSAVNYGKRSEYLMKFSAADKSGNQAENAYFVLVLNDVTKPKIAIRNYGRVEACKTGLYKNAPRAVAIDNIDGRVSYSVSPRRFDTTKLGNVRFNYVAADKAGIFGLNGRNNVGKKSAVSRVVDTTKPVFKPLTPKTLECGQKYSIATAVCTDNRDNCRGGSFSAQKTQNGVEVTKPGQYGIKYTCTDKARNAASATRRVVVKDTRAPTLSISDVGHSNTKRDINTGEYRPSVNYDGLAKGAKWNTGYILVHAAGAKNEAGFINHLTEEGTGFKCTDHNCRDNKPKTKVSVYYGKAKAVTCPRGNSCSNTGWKKDRAFEANVWRAYGRNGRYAPNSWWHPKWRYFNPTKICKAANGKHVAQGQHNCLVFMRDGIDIYKYDDLKLKFSMTGVNVENFGNNYFSAWVRDYVKVHLRKQNTQACPNSGYAHHSTHYAVHGGGKKNVEVALTSEIKVHGYKFLCVALQVRAHDDLRSWSRWAGEHGISWNRSGTHGMWGWIRNAYDKMTVADFEYSAICGKNSGAPAATKYDGEKLGFFTFKYTCTDQQGLSTTKCRTVQNKAFCKPKVVASYNTKNLGHIRNLNARFLGIPKSAMSIEGGKLNIYASADKIGKIYKKMVIGSGYAKFLGKFKATRVVPPAHTCTAIHPRVVTRGAPRINLQAGKTYREQGAVCYKLRNCKHAEGDFTKCPTLPVKTRYEHAGRSIGKITSCHFPLREFVAEYHCSDGDLQAVPSIRVVDIVDKVNPTCALKGPTSVNHEASFKYKDAGFRSADQCGRKPRVALKINGNHEDVGTSTYTYTATDASGNTCTKTRVVKTIDTLKPVIALKYNGKEIDRSNADDRSQTTSNTRGAFNPAAKWSMP